MHQLLPASMDTQFTEEQNRLREAARDFLRAECPMSVARAWLAAPEGRIDDGVWPKLADMGWLGLVLPESAGGAGLGWVDLVVLLEETGRALLPHPLLSTTIAGVAVALFGSEEQRGEWLPRFASGELRACLALLDESASWETRDVGLAGSTAAAQGGDLTLRGSLVFVPDAQCADVILVAVRDPAGPKLALLERGAPGLGLRGIDTIDPTRRLCQLTLDGVRVSCEAILGDGTPDRDVRFERLLDLAKVAICGESCGMAERVLELSVDYAKTRVQFGAPIGSFQAIQHKCADMFCLVESAKSACYYAAWTLAEDEPDAHAAACLAKAFCSEALTRVAAEGIQIHGGLGFTWEQDLHLYFKRAKSNELAYGDPSWNRELAARALIDDCSDGDNDGGS